MTQPYDVCMKSLTRLTLEVSILCGLTALLWIHLLGDGRTNRAYMVTLRWRSDDGPYYRATITTQTDGSPSPSEELYLFHSAIGAVLELEADVRHARLKEFYADDETKVAWCRFLGARPTDLLLEYAEPYQGSGLEGWRIGGLAALGVWDHLRGSLFADGAALVHRNETDEGVTEIWIK
jgi:hypothetical protein